ncbi:MAG: YnbE family lipoprotein [Pseudomonadota bacterium]|nr:YnbE family lipoprotein [Pseudomonadota bacterium]
MARTGGMVVAGLVLATMLAACEPRVAVEAPKEPITINLNIKLDADVRVRLEEAAKEDIKKNPEIF